MRTTISNYRDGGDTKELAGLGLTIGETTAILSRVRPCDDPPPPLVGEGGAVCGPFHFILGLLASWVTVDYWPIYSCLIHFGPDVQYTSSA